MRRANKRACFLKIKLCHHELCYIWLENRANQQKQQCSARLRSFFQILGDLKSAMSSAASANSKQGNSVLKPAANSSSSNAVPPTTNNGLQNSTSEMSTSKVNKNASKTNFWLLDEWLNGKLPKDAANWVKFTFSRSLAAWESRYWSFKVFNIFFQIFNCYNVCSPKQSFDFRQNFSNNTKHNFSLVSSFSSCGIFD